MIMAADVKKTLTEVKGVGDAKAQTIIDAGFTTLEKLRKTSVEDFTKIKGVSEENAKDILIHLAMIKKAEKKPVKQEKPAPVKDNAEPKTATEKKPATTKKTAAKPSPEKKTPAAAKPAPAKVKEEPEKVEIVEDKQENRPKIKPKLTTETKEQLKLRKDLKQRTPTFLREEWFRYKRIPKNWRRPDGITSKMRRNLQYRPSVVRVGFRGPKTVRGLHSSGFEEIMVHTVNDLKQINPDTQAARIGGTVGTRKRLEIIKQADERDIRVLNRGV